MGGRSYIQKEQRHDRSFSEASAGRGGMEMRGFLPGPDGSVSSACAALKRFIPVGYPYYARGTVGCSCESCADACVGIGQSRNRVCAIGEKTHDSGKRRRIRRHEAGMPSACVGSFGACITVTVVAYVLMAFPARSPPWAARSVRAWTAAWTARSSAPPSSRCARSACCGGHI